jgi:hypothetical protein
MPRHTMSRGRTKPLSPEGESSRREPQRARGCPAPQLCTRTGAGVLRIHPEEPRVIFSPGASRDTRANRFSLSTELGRSLRHPSLMAKLSPSRRGDGAHHRALRERWKHIVEAGLARCARCGHVIESGTPFDLGHVDGSERTLWSGVEHRSCNRKAEERKALRSRTPSAASGFAGRASGTRRG